MKPLLFSNEPKHARIATLATLILTIILIHSYTTYYTVN